MLTSRSTLMGTPGTSLTANKIQARNSLLRLNSPRKKQERTFVFQGTVGTEAIPAWAVSCQHERDASLCRRSVGDAGELRQLEDCSISARSVRIDTPDLILRDISQRKQESTQRNAGLFINTHKAEGHANRGFVWSGETSTIQCVEHALDYPLAKYFQRVAAPFADLDTPREVPQTAKNLLGIRALTRKAVWQSAGIRLSTNESCETSLEDGFSQRSLKEGVLQ